MKSPYDIIQNAIITEKATNLKNQKKYVFQVLKSATKNEIKKAIEKIYDVKVKSVNIINMQGKTKRAGRLLKEGKRPDFKKAIVTLSKGEINFF